MFLYIVLFSQKDSINKKDIRWKILIEKQDEDERRKADSNVIVKIIYDTLGSDYIEQHFYHNGNLYYQIPFVNGMANGIYKEYYPNGQLKYKREMKDGYYNSDICNSILFDRFGDALITVICLPYDKEVYSFQTGYFYGEPYYLMIRNPENILVAEFSYVNNKWKKNNYHRRSVRYANKLLRVYKKNPVKRWMD